MFMYFLITRGSYILDSAVLISFFVSFFAIEMLSRAQLLRISICAYLHLIVNISGNALPLV